MRVVLMAVLGVLLLPAHLQAGGADSRKPTVDLQLFQPSPGANNFITTESGEVNSHLSVYLGTGLNYARNPLAVQVLKEQGGKEDIGAVVGYRVDANFMASIGLFNVGELGLVMPMFLQGGQDKKGLEGANVSMGGALKAFSQGDLRIVPKIRAINVQEGLFSLAFVGTVIAPTASKAPYASENSVVIAPSLAVSSRTKFFRTALNAGYRLRDKTIVEPVEGLVLLTVDDEIFAKAAMALDLYLGKKRSVFEIVAEVYGHTPADNPFGTNAKGKAAKKQQAARTSMEVDVGFRWVFWRRFVLTGGAGAGILPQGYGQPVPRVYAGLGFYTGQFGIVDSDRDGVPDSMDQCPGKREDRDGFKDRDGCPDLDNDGDKVLDEDDQCPNAAEDKDGISDEDGCPETDIDEDGVLDENDQCQDEKEDMDGFEDENGCPDPDNDDDGIVDNADKCPMEAEDRDGFQDLDGCPDTDNDGDGLPDLGDLCPNHAEDKDGVADDDGCPEDNDGDGIPDDLDKCPDKAEIYNGIKDEDGCPEKLRVKSLVKVTEEKIEIKEKIFFKSASTNILPKSFDVLKQIASVLKNYKHITKVGIEGYTDSRGSRSRNVRLSQDRAQATKDYLVKQGVEADRLVATGYGPENPIATNRTAAGREKNRRVEFKILEQKPIGVDVSDTEPEETGEGIDMEFGAEPPAEEKAVEEAPINFNMDTDESPPTSPPPPSQKDAGIEEAEKSKSKSKFKRRRKGQRKAKKKEPELEFDTGGEIEFQF